MALKINDEAYLQATQAIVGLLRKQEPAINANVVDGVLRKYVSLGAANTIQDYHRRQGVGVNDPTVLRVAQEYGDASVGQVYNYLGALEVLASSGNVSGSIAEPNKKNRDYERQLELLHRNDPNPVAQGIENFFGVAKSGVESVLKGLGINLPIQVIVGGVVVVGVLMLYVALRKK